MISALLTFAATIGMLAYQVTTFHRTWARWPDPAALVGAAIFFFIMFGAVISLGSFVITGRVV